MDTPFIFRGFPRLSILFYTIFHKKASQNQSKKRRDFLGKLLKVTSTFLTKVEISLKRIFMVELSVRRLW